jgi:hypothetical protein
MSSSAQQPAGGMMMVVRCCCEAGEEDQLLIINSDSVPFCLIMRGESHSMGTRRSKKEDDDAGMLGE